MPEDHDDSKLDLGASDVQEYVGAFQASSDRARYALFVVITATVLVAIANYNIQDWGWPARRLATWYRFAPKDPAVKPEPFPFFGGDAEQLQTAREEYIKQFVGRSVLAASPIPGVSIDVNDVGIVGGIALCLLMLVQALCIMREHENLHLALYKVRRLHEDEGLMQKHGNSRANLLYHALAMSQVISSPPTLARWENRSILNHLYLVFFIPPITYAWVVFVNFDTSARGSIYGAPIVALLVLQCTMFVMLVNLAVICLLNSKAMADRWQRAFFRINPRLRKLSQPGEWQWLKMGRLFRSRTDPEVDLAMNVIMSLVDNLDFAEGRLEGSIHVRLEKRPVGDKLDAHELKSAVDALREAGMAAARQWCLANRASFVRLESFEPSMNAITRKSWELAGTWSFTYDPQ